MALSLRSTNRSDAMETGARIRHAVGIFFAGVSKNCVRIHGGKATGAMTVKLTKQ
jgi:hypothetical protein